MAQGATTAEAAPRKGKVTMSAFVTLQLNLGHNEAGDWANRSAGEAATATADADGGRNMILPDEPQHELMIRLHDLRGAVEVMKDQPHGITIAETRTARASIGYGDPLMYHGMCFLVRSTD
jgi:hypothetical protein